MEISNKIIEEMFDDWLWRRYWNELENKAIKQIEKEEGFLKSIIGGKKFNQKILDRHWKLHEKLKKEVLQTKEVQER